jgi:hypothetical protein
MLSVGLKSHHENLAGVMIHRLNPWSRVNLWTPILDLGGQAIHRVSRVYVPKWAACYTMSVGCTTSHDVFILISSSHTTLEVVSSFVSYSFTFCSTFISLPHVLHGPSASVFRCSNPTERLNL